MGEEMLVDQHVENQGELGFPPYDICLKTLFINACLWQLTGEEKDLRIICEGGAVLSTVLRTC